MGTFDERQKYLCNCAKTVQGQLALNSESFKDHKTVGEIEAALNKGHWTAAYLRLMQAPDDQVGKLACSRDIEQVRRLATDAVIRAMALKVWADLHPKNVLKCRFCDWTTAKLWRQGQMTVDGFNRLRNHLDAEHGDKAEEIATAVFGSRRARDEADIEAFFAEQVE